MALLTNSLGVVKKMLDSLKGDTFTAESMRFFMPAFKSLMASCMSAEILRSLALFVTYSIHKEKPSPNGSQHTRNTRSGSRPKRSSTNRSIEGEIFRLPRVQIGVEILRAYTEVLCNCHETATIKKFARTVTNKVGNIYKIIFFYILAN